MAIRCSYGFIHVCCLVTSNKIVAVQSLHSIRARRAHAVQAGFALAALMLCRLRTATTMYVYMYVSAVCHSSVPQQYATAVCPQQYAHSSMPQQCVASSAIQL